MSEARIFQDKEKGVTTVVFDSTRYDALAYKDRRIRHDLDVPYMPSRIVATTRLHAPDTFDPEVGVREAFYKADQKHKREMNKALKKWQRGQIQDCIAVGADLFEEVLKEFGYEKGDK